MTDAKKTREKLDALAACLHHTFRDETLLLQAMTHSSYAHESLADPAFHNERLEFLGDAVLELAATRMLYETLSVPEGDLSRIRSQIVCEGSLAYAAGSMRLEQYLLLSRGEEKNGGRSRNSLRADFFEALIGALYLDAGYETAEEFIKRELFSRIPEIEGRTEDNYKSVLQESVQARGIAAPEYELVKEEGPPHDRFFTVQVRIDGRVLGTGSGRSKKEAEQHAARSAYERLRK